MISRLQLASEKQGRSVPYTEPSGEGKGFVLVPMGGPLRRLCVRAWTADIFGLRWKGVT